MSIHLQKNKHKEKYKKLSVDLSLFHRHKKLSITFFFFVRVCLSVLIASRHVILSCEKNTIEILGVKHNCRR